MVHPQRIAHRLRRYLLIVGVAFELAGLTWVFGPYLRSLLRMNIEPAGLLGTPLCLPDPADDWVYLGNALVVLGLLLLAQWAFLRPGRLLSIRLTTRGRPLKGAVVVAAGMGMLLTLGAFSLVLELLDLWKPIISPGDQGPAWSSSMAGIWAGMIAVWAIWAALFLRYWRDGDRYTQLGKVVRALVAGSVAEAIIAAPVHAFVSRQDHCYCERGSYTTLICAGAVLFWAFGPGIVLLFLRENYRRVRLFPHCHRCGYDLRGGLVICPECGTPVAPYQREAAQRDEYSA
jgi:hypothetical protein